MIRWLEQLKFIRKAHEGQVDKQGQDYYTTHLVPVSLMVAPKLLIPARAHDILEDTPTTVTDLIRVGFSDYDITLIRLLTHNKGMTREEYLLRLRQSTDAVQIKIADVTNNLSRLATLRDESTRLRLERKYVHTLYTLAGIT